MDQGFCQYGGIMSRAKILIVDDSSFARRRLQNILEHAGHEIVGSVEDGRQVLYMYEALNPDLVTLDYLMAGKNGEELLTELIQHDPDAKVIMVSGSGDKAIEGRVLDAGAAVFVEKFNGHAELLRAVEQVIET